MLSFDVKRKINTLRDILVGKVPDPKAQVEQITIALIYKFMDDMDIEGLEFGGTRQFFTGEYEKYAWTEIMKPENSGQQRAFLYAEGIEKMATNPNLPQLFRDIFRGAYIPYRDPDTLNMFLKEVRTSRMTTARIWAMPLSICCLLWAVRGMPDSSARPAISLT